MSQLTEEQLDERAKRQEALQRTQYDEDLRRVMALPAGRRFMFRLIEDTCGLRRVLHHGEETHAAAEVNGRRAVGCFLDQEVQRVASADWVAMWTESLDSTLKALAERKDAEDADGRANPGDSHNGGRG